MTTAIKQSKPATVAKAPKAIADTKTLKVVKPVLITGAGDINKAITNIATRAKNMDRDLHILGVSVILHSAKNNDPDVATRLVAAMGKSQRKQAMTAWLVGFGAFDVAQGELVYVKAKALHVMEQKNIDAAMAEPFWEYAAPEPTFRPVNLQADIERILKRAEAALTNPKQDASLIQPDKLAALRALVSGVSASIETTPSELASQTPV